MAWRYYLVPYEVADVPPFGRVQQPKYVAESKWWGMPYGREPLILVAVDQPDADHEALAKQPDVLALPVDLDARVEDGELDALRGVVDVPSGATGRDVIAFVGKACLVRQMLGQRTAETIDPSVRVGDLSSNARLDVIGLGGDVLKREGAAPGDQWAVLKNQDGSITQVSVHNTATVGAALGQLAQSLPSFQLGIETF